MALVVSAGAIGGITLFGWWLSWRWSWGRRLGFTMLVLLLGVAIRNLTGWQPDVVVSAWVSGPLTSLAIAELLPAIRLQAVLSRARQLLPLYAAALLATLVGVLIGALLLAGPLAEQRSILAGLYTATFSGGSLNFVSVGRTLSPSPSLLALATAADQIVFTLWFAISLGWGRRHRALGLGATSNQSIPAVAFASMNGDLKSGWLQALVWGLVAVSASDLIRRAVASIGLEIPSILVLTSVALLMAQLPRPNGRRPCRRCAAAASPQSLPPA